MKFSNFVILMSFVFKSLCSLNASSLGAHVNDWLDPALRNSIPKVQNLINNFEVQISTKNATDETDKDLGFSSVPGTRFDYMFLSLIHNKKGEKPERIKVLDVGCGFGYMSALSVLAGGKVDAVDLREVVTEANKNIYKSTKEIIGYSAADSKSYYRAIPANVLDKGASPWNTELHEVALCSNLVHFFVEEEIQEFAKKISQNIPKDGVLFIQADTPFFNKACLDFYLERKGKAVCPGLGIYSKEKGSKALKIVGQPVAYDKSVHTLRPGFAYEGIFNPEGDIAKDTR